MKKNQQFFFLQKSPKNDIMTLSCFLNDFFYCALQ